MTQGYTYNRALQDAAHAVEELASAASDERVFKFTITLLARLERMKRKERRARINDGDTDNHQ